MKVKIGPYKNWIGPYQIAEVLCFWAKDVKDEYEFARKPDWVHNFGSWLAGGEDKDSWLQKVCLWIESKRKRNIKIKIDRWDTWSMDHTLALIALPMLKQLKATKHGSPFVDLEDVPEEMRGTETDEWDSQTCFDFYNDSSDKIGQDVHTRWAWVLDEMIFAFECEVDDSWEEAFRSGDIDTVWKPVDREGNDVTEEEAKLFQMTDGPNHTYKCDYAGMAVVQKRIDNGFRLFGRYYQGLWD